MASATDHPGGCADWDGPFTTLAHLCWPCGCYGAEMPGPLCPIGNTDSLCNTKAKFNTSPHLCTTHMPQLIRYLWPETLAQNLPHSQDSLLILSLQTAQYGNVSLSQAYHRITEF